MRFDIDSYKEIADSLLRNKTRSLLTGFGIFWGIFMLLFLKGGGDGFKAMISQNFEGFASNAVMVVSSTTTKPYHGFKEGRYWTIDITDVDRIRNNIPELAVVSPMNMKNDIMLMRNEYSFSTSAKGVRSDYQMVEMPQMKYGRYMNEMDELQERKVCVIGKQVYEALFPEGGDPCGEFIQVGSSHFKVVGVDYSAGNMTIGESAARSVVVPYNVMMKTWFGNSTNVDVICMCAKQGIKTSEMETKLRGLMARIHHFDPTDKQALFVINTEEMFALVDNLFRGLNFLIMLIGIGTILAGAIGVSNIMMVTVKERTTEIGIRRAIGATPRDILSQIIWEGTILTLIAGMGGVVFSVFVLEMLDMGMRMSGTDAVFQVDFWFVLGAAAVITVIGILAALAPASRAMNIKPVDAMRDE